MPFIISAEEAAKRILAGIGSKKFEIAFPKRLAFPMTLLKFLPDSLFFALTKKMLK
jgi:short-subunit dehydrogenase